MLRKFLLVAGLALLERGSSAQLLLAIFVAFVYLIAFVNTNPLQTWEADRMNQAANVQIFLSLMGAMALKTQQARVLDCACRVALARTRALMTILWPWKRACHKCLWAVWPAEANTPALPLSPACLLDAPVHSPPGAGGFG